MVSLSCFAMLLRYVESISQAFTQLGDVVAVCRRVITLSLEAVLNINGQYWFMAKQQKVWWCTHSIMSGTVVGMNHRADVVFPGRFLFDWQGSQQIQERFVESLADSVRFRVKGARAGFFDAKNGAQFSDDFALKGLPLVWVQSLRNAITHYELLIENLCCCMCRLVSRWNCDSILTEVVSNDKYITVPSWVLQGEIINAHQLHWPAGLYVN